MGWQAARRDLHLVHGRLVTETSWLDLGAFSLENLGFLREVAALTCGGAMLEP
jgi:hypothetical protein